MGKNRAKDEQSAGVYEKGRKGGREGKKDPRKSVCWRCGGKGHKGEGKTMIIKMEPKLESGLRGSSSTATPSVEVSIVLPEVSEGEWLADSPWLFVITIFPDGTSIGSVSDAELLSTGLLQPGLLGPRRKH